MPSTQAEPRPCRWHLVSVVGNGTERHRDLVSTNELAVFKATTPVQTVVDVFAILATYSIWPGSVVPPDCATVQTSAPWSSHVLLGAPPTCDWALSESRSCEALSESRSREAQQNAARKVGPRLVSGGARSLPLTAASCSRGLETTIPTHLSSERAVDSARRSGPEEGNAELPDGEAESHAHSLCPVEKTSCSWVSSQHAFDHLALIRWYSRDASQIGSLHGLDPGPETAQTERNNSHPLKYAELPSAYTTDDIPVVPTSGRSIPLSFPTMSYLSEVLERIGLSTYLQTLCVNGFQDWETVVDITEEDLTALEFKLGHRRALQREIATWRGIPQTLSLKPEAASPELTSLSTSALETLARQQSTPPPREKRRYRRHPRADANAPKKPKTAYVNFADQLRTDPQVSQLSFVHIAREVGRRWQELSPEQKRVWESNAARAMQEYESKMDEYKKTDDWRTYQAYLNDFRAQQSQPTAGRRSVGVRTISHSTREHSRASPELPESPGSSLPSSASSCTTNAELCHNALTLAFSELISLRGEILNQAIQTYDEDHLPSEELTRRSIYAFIRGTGSLLFMWTYEQADEILNRVYRPKHKIDAMDLAECFTIAAMGAHYDMDCFPDRIRKILYASGTLHFHERTARTDYLRTMRLLLSMSFYALLEKHMSARYLIAAGLQIARWMCPPLHRTSTGVVDENWRKIHRSLMFMDSWLSYTLGYSSEVTPQDVSVRVSFNNDYRLSDRQQAACTPDRLASDTIDELIHTQTSKVGLIAAEIAKTLAAPELATRENVDMLTRKLEIWRTEVPLILQLPTLTSEVPSELSLYQRRAILMVHIMYLGAVVLVYRQLLVATAESQLTDGAAKKLGYSSHDARGFRNECAIAASTIARILRLIAFDGTLTRRCWLVIYWAFTAAIVLLHSASTKLLDGQCDGVELDLGFAKECMDMLEPCRSLEPVAARYLDTLWPLYDSLRDMHQRMVGRAKTSFSYLLQADPNQLSPPIPLSKHEMGPVSEKLSVLLTDPFGRKQNFAADGSMRRALNADGSCSVFWWK
ncbi:uncharacterized protein EKO05_0010292 [Ascochyta rabiei]|uniref:uncharacterized protein n=1 Tax=Didymella rabiei TaxID=5454 RepID=UPI0019017687|nr:uncharacterized protein EKO05_0010292 [Ascochyta rabiei]UPX20046.1 hypothetical protein EKO05_0010292 [Ascochyta rabiei]